VAVRIRQLTREAEHRRVIAEFRARRAADQQARQRPAARSRRRPRKHPQRAPGMQTCTPTTITLPEREHPKRPGAAPGQPGRGAGGHHPRAAPAAGDRRGGRLGRRAVTLHAGLGLPTRGLRRDLALGRPPERQLAEQATAAITGMLLAAALAGLFAAGGVIVAWQLPAAGAVALGAAGFTVPALAARQEAAARPGRPWASSAGACPVDHGAGSLSQMRMAATSTLPRWTKSRLS
jgi:hypothetical protein